MAKIKIEIDMDNDAFDPGGLELCRILEYIRGDILFGSLADYLEPKKIRDNNGNTVGIIEVTK